MEARDALTPLLDTALAVIRDQAQKKALERVAQAQHRYLQEKARAGREKSAALIKAIADLDLSRKLLQMQFDNVSASLTPDARSAIHSVLDELNRERRQYVLEKDRVERGEEASTSVNDLLPALPAGAPSSAPAPGPEVINGIALHPGDVLAVTRQGGLYQHFAIYTGNWRVIHYAAENGDFSGRITIHEAPFRDFQSSSDLIYALDFSPEGGCGIRRGEGARKRSPAPDLTDALMSSLFEDLRQLRGYHLYTPEQTVARAKSRLGENRYSLPANNCEHFALWCKTGVSESIQVEEWIVRIAKLLTALR